MDLREAELALECLLFVANEPLPRKRLRELLEIDEQMLEAALASLRESLASRSLTVVEVAGGLRMMTRPEMAKYVRRFYEPRPERLSRMALEVLAIIAYRQPITRPEIDAIRGVNSSGSLETLLRKGLIKEVGRKNAPGRPILYATTQEFLTVAGLNDLSELPPLDAEVPHSGVLGIPSAEDEELQELPLDFSREGSEEQNAK